MDNGFASLEDLEAAAAHGTEVFRPLKNQQQWLAEGKDPYQPKPSDKPAVAAWRVRMGTTAAPALYRLRASTAEWVNAGCRNRGLNQFRVRGLRKVLACVLWQVLAHNLLRAAARPCPQEAAAKPAAGGGQGEGAPQGVRRGGEGRADRTRGPNTTPLQS